MARTQTTANRPVSTDESMLGAGSRVHGKVHGDGALRVLGEIEGDVVITGELAIDEGGAVRGDVQAAAVTIRGDLTGDVHATGPVAILAGANVAGDMGGAQVSLDEGARFAGRIEAEFDLPAGLEPRHGR